MKKPLIFLTGIILLAGLSSLKRGYKTPLYKDEHAPIKQRVEDLLKRMTLDEKMMQLSQYTFGLNDNPNNIEREKSTLDPRVGSLIYFGNDPVLRNEIQKRAIEETRLGIPILFGFDIIHGCKTLFPIPLATGCSFDTALARKASEIAARESYLSGINWTFSPMINIARDPRWGRISEGYGEDPYTTSMFAIASVKGYQGNKNIIDSLHIAATLKHYIAYGLSEGGRDYTYTDVSRQALWETYLPAFKAGVDAGAKTVMSSFNDISGTPATINKYLLTDVLKNDWGFKGFVVSDWDAIAQLMAQGVAKDSMACAQKALMAGTDMDMLDGIYERNLKELLKEHRVTMQRMDDAVRRILTVKFQLGLFDHPYTPVIPASQRYLQPYARTIASKLAAESMVLLKNKKNILPIPSSIKSIAVIGPMVKDSFDLMGAWRGRADVKEVSSIYTALQEEFNGKISLHYAKGCDFDSKDKSDFDSAIQAAKISDEVILFLGEKNGWSGENASRSNISLPKVQEDLIKAIKEKTGKPVILVLNNGRPLALANIEPDVNAILEAWQPGTLGASAIAGILSGRINPSGKLDVTFPLTTGQIPVFYDMRQSARPQSGIYQDLGTNDPMYWFGYGLTYTTYHFGKVKLSATSIKKKQQLIATVHVTNTGTRDGEETVLWYISHPEATISRPQKELKHFQKLGIKAGQTVTYKFVINPKAVLAYPNDKGEPILEAGDYYLMVGNQKLRFELRN